MCGGGTGGGGGGGLLSFFFSSFFFFFFRLTIHIAMYLTQTVYPDFSSVFSSIQNLVL